MAASSSESSGEQQYSLRWNDFHSSILSSFRHLRDEEDFVDVTLACDSSSFTAHKVVLSACSPYFRRLLKANPCQHPIVILRDVPSSDMESLLRFMYHGEVHVGQDQLPAFLKTAQMLQVRGLADVNSGTATKMSVAGPSGSATNNSAPTTPRNVWNDNSRAEQNDTSPPPEKRPRSYSPPPVVNHVENKSDLQESLLGQALEGGPTIHTTTNNVQQSRSTCDDSNSVSDNEEDASNNDSILNSVKTEPSEMLNDSLEHHRGTFPTALLGLQGLMPGPSGIHAAANQDPNYGRWQPSGGEGSGSSSCSAWLAGNNSSSRNEASGSLNKQDLLLQTHQQDTSQQQSQQQQQQALNALSSLNPEQLTIMHQKLTNNLQSLQQKQSSEQQQQLNLMLQSCAKKKIEELALLQHPFQQHQLDANCLQGKPKCPECGKIYSNNSNLKQHIVNVHTVQTAYISCHICSKQFKTKQYLQIHLLSMHGIRKRKSYPVYQMQTHAQAQQQVAQFVSQNPQQQQQPSPFADRWTTEEKQ